MRILSILFAAGALVACNDSAAPPPQTVETATPGSSEATGTPASTPAWSRVSTEQGLSLRLQENGALVASLACHADGSGLHAASDRFKPVMSEERFTLGAGDEAFTLVADLDAGRPLGVEASGNIPPDFLDRIEAGQRVAFNYGAQNLGPFPPIPEADARVFAGACRAIAS